MPTVIERVNANSAGMDFLLRGGGVTATGEYLEKGKRESFELKGTLLYRKPRNLYLQLQHAVGGKMEVGSNDQEFWVWKKIGDDRYWWGRHEEIDDNTGSQMPIRPDYLLDVLGLGELPTEQDRTGSPVFWVGPQRYELLFLNRGGGRTWLTKTIDIDRRPPYLVREMVYFDPDGHPTLVAKLGDYREVGGSPVLAPRHIRMEWLDDGSWLDLTFNEMRRFDQPAAEKKFISPRQRGTSLGEVERVGRPKAREAATAPTRR